MPFKLGPQGEFVIQDIKMESSMARCLRLPAAASQTYAHSRLLQDIEPA
jgi:hypothetical protein